MDQDEMNQNELIQNELVPNELAKLRVKIKGFSNNWNVT